MDIEFKTKDISFTCKVKETETGNKILKLLPIKSKYQPGVMKSILIYQKTISNPKTTLKRCLTLEK